MKLSEVCSLVTVEKVNCFAGEMVLCRFKCEYFYSILISIHPYRLLSQRFPRLQSKCGRILE